MIILFSILPNTIKLKPVVLRKENEDQTLNKCLKLLNYGIKKINKSGFQFIQPVQGFVMETS